MANIELVIKIPEEIYEIVSGRETNVSQEALINARQLVALALLDSTPLPKGHGDLIDRKELLRQPMDLANYPSNYVRIAPTIIEAEQGQIQGYVWQFKKLCTLSSVEPERKPGKWHVEGFEIWCTNCGFHPTTIEAFNYCPNCRAKMKMETRE